MSINMDDIMRASLGEVSNEIRATYKKTVNVRQYETEVVELEAKLDVGDEELNGAERMLVSAILQAQLEYTAYCNLAYKGLVTNTELQSRREQLIGSVQAIKEKAERVTGRKLDKYIKHTDLSD